MSDFLTIGGGSVNVLNTQGGSGIPTLTHLNYEDSLVPDGRYSNGTLDPFEWLSSEGVSGIARDQTGPNYLGWGPSPVAFQATLTIGSLTLTNSTHPSGSLNAGFIISGNGLSSKSVVYTSNATTHQITLNKQPYITTPGGSTAVQSLTYQDPTVNYTAQMTVSNSVTNTDEFGVSGSGSVVITKSTGMTNTQPCDYNKLIRLPDNCNVGVRFFLKIDPNPGATPGSYVRIYVRPYWSTFQGMSNIGIPLHHDEWVSLEYGIKFDQVTGRRMWSFTANTDGSTVLNTLVGSDPSFNYDPINWLQIGDAVSGTNIQAGSTITSIDYVHSTITISLPTTATGSAVSLTAVAAATWAKFIWTNLNISTPKARPERCNALKLRVDISNISGGINTYLTDWHATTW